MDQIVVIQNGPVVETGKLAELLDAEGPTLKTMLEHMPHGSYFLHTIFPG
jgi:ABC-type transport system involved in cytochrome bd biosynthesis fused ATPase/permease subunit